MSFPMRGLFFTVMVLQVLIGATRSYSNSCGRDKFLCNGYCSERYKFCNGGKDCSSGEDERYCDSFMTRYEGGCPKNYWKCKDGRCIPGNWRCNGLKDCVDISDELDCVYPSEVEVPVTTVEVEDDFLSDSLVKSRLVSWFVGRRKNGTTTNKWSHELPRTAVALFLAEKGFFSPGNRTLEEMSYELSIQLLTYLADDGRVDKKDLATYIHAMIVTCLDTRNFYGRDLVSELRSKVESGGNVTNPFEMLALCNAGDKMTDKDAQRVLSVYNTRDRAFWIDNQAMAAIALACISSRSDVILDERNLIEMEQELKRRQFRNGTVENLKTTALVIQSLIATQSYKRDFDLKTAFKVILQSQKLDGSVGSFIDSYYVLPAVSNSSLLDINAEHCQRPTTSEEEALSEFQRTKEARVSAQYSVWIGTEVDLMKTWTLKVPFNSSLYDILELANRLDTRQRIQYYVVSGKPYVTSVAGLQDDIEKGLYWYTCLRTQKSEAGPKQVEGSPVDVKIGENQELILWYKSKK